MAELLLYEASRAQLVDEVDPAGAGSGRVVLCDRFADSSTAYQGSRGASAARRGAAMNRAATAGLTPDRTVLLDMDPASGIGARHRRGADRLESEDLAFHERVREGFLALAPTSPPASASSTRTATWKRSPRTSRPRWPTSRSCSHALGGRR